MRRFWPRFASQRTGLAAAAYVLVLTLVMLAVAVMPGSDPHAITNEVMLPPAAAHVLGTDELGRNVLLGILHGIRAYLFITHDISVARAFSDRVAVMMQGEIVEAGPTERVLAKPVHAYTRRLLAASAGFRLDGSKELAAC